MIYRKKVQHMNNKILQKGATYDKLECVKRCNIW